MSDETKTKTIECKLSVKTGVSNYEVCDFIEKILKNSTLNSVAFELDIIETKVIKSE